MRLAVDDRFLYSEKEVEQAEQLLDHGRDTVTLYGHLKEYIVKAGDKVTRGQHIGNVGNSGRSTGSHLHYEVRLNNVPVNPRPYVMH